MRPDLGPALLRTHPFGSFVTLIGLLTTGCNLDIPSSIRLGAGDAVVVISQPDGAVPTCIDTDLDGICASQGDCNDFNPLVRPGLSEICDGLDNDCDQQIDEGVEEEGESCLVFEEDCTFEGVRVCDAVEGLICAVSIPVELCNNLDDDCDGVVDEGNPGGGAPCDAGGGVGACGAGTFTCFGGNFGCFANVTPGAVGETCNGEDDDCDGLVDEGSSGVPLTATCYGGPSTTSNVGKCHPGTWQCQNGTFGACVGEQRPLPPRCDLPDDWDCNGELDNEQAGCVCTFGQSRPCYGGPEGTVDVGQCTGGSQSCSNNTWGPCTSHITPIAELCDGLDNDCDGNTDEGFDLGAACTSGLGTCAAAGERVCAPGGLTALCDATPGTPMNENNDACNGQDDDCDGRVDEALAAQGGLCTNNLLGACTRSGVLVCDLETEGFVCTAPVVQGTAELCNDMDDDCDGEVDEDFQPLGTACTVGTGSCSRTGTWICSPINGTRICDVQPGGPSPEVCDGLDNDCDDAVDEGFGVGNACLSPGVCGSGVLECAPLGQSRCSTGPNGSTSLAINERCNGLDDDCDGAVDEIYVYILSNQCWGCNTYGVFECAADGNGITCSTSPLGSAAPTEICGDAIDNDCDYTADEAECTEP